MVLIEVEASQLAHKKLKKQSNKNVYMYIQSESISIKSKFIL